jgi:serine/threonine-protein kinase RsbW
VIAISLKPTDSSWMTLSFQTTLYTRPILDKLVANVPSPWQAEIRLGLQEALVNAARHGNQLDPMKYIIVEYANHDPIYQWLIRDQGCGFVAQRELNRCRWGHIRETDESGRGTLILTQIFDFVQWNDSGNQLYLGKYIHHYRQPLIC